MIIKLPQAGETYRDEVYIEMVWVRSKEGCEVHMECWGWNCLVGEREGGQLRMRYDGLDVVREDARDGKKIM